MIPPAASPAAEPRKAEDGGGPAPAAPPRDILGALLRQGASHGISAELLLVIL